MIELSSNMLAEDIRKLLEEYMGIAFEEVHGGYIGFAGSAPVAVIERGGDRLVVLTDTPAEEAVKIGLLIGATGVVRSRKFTLREFIDEQWKNISPAAKERLLAFFREKNFELQGTRIMKEEVLRCLSKLIMTPGKGEQLQKLLKRGRKALPEVAEVLSNVLRYQDLREVESE